MWTEFRTFLIKDNVIGLAIAVILGATLNKLVGSVVDDLIMPLVSLATAAATGGVKWEEIQFALTSDPEGPAIRLGLFLAALLNFFIIGFVCWRIARIFTRPKEEVAKAA